MVAGQDHALIQHHRTAFTGVFHFRIARYAARSGCGLIDVGVHQTEFQRRGRAKDFLRTRGITDTRQFNHDTVGTLTLNQRFGHAELVYAVTQNVDVLLNGVFTGFFQTFVGHHRFQRIVTTAK